METKKCNGDVSISFKLRKRVPFYMPVNTVFGNVPHGSTLAYQLTDLKPYKTSFYFYSPHKTARSLLPPDQYPHDILTFPKIPMLASCNQLFTLPEEFSDTTEPILQQISTNIEHAGLAPSEQHSCPSSRDGFKKEKFISLLQILVKCCTERRNHPI